MALVEKKGYPKIKYFTMHPKISIITVCFNAKDCIEETILSVINQSYPNIEYIIIDGGSSDGTVDIINKYNTKITYWISEPDKGIYDAMNKGINIASGKWINFMNAGDTFCETTTVESCINFLRKKECIDVLYGNTILNYKNEKYLSYPHNLSLINRITIFCHQSCFIKNSILKKNLFDIKYKIVADYNQIRNLYNKGCLFKYINIPICNYEAENGISSQNITQRMKEYAKINYQNNFIIYYYVISVIHVKDIIKRLIPKKIINNRKKNFLNNNPLIKKIEN